MSESYRQRKDALNYFLKAFEKENDSVTVIETYRKLLAEIAADRPTDFLAVTDKLEKM